MIAFGLGGVLVEVMKDITFRMTRVDRKDALSMLDSIGAAEVLRGVRGGKGVNRAALADIISKVSKLVNDFPEIDEVDLNPVFATEKGARAVDVRIVIGEQPPARQRFSQSEILNAMQRIMNPRSVAVIGASAEDGKIGNSVMKNLINGGYRGAIYPIHPKAGEILGRKAYPSVLDVTEEIDVAVFAIPARLCAVAMEEVGRKKNSRRGDDSIGLRRSRRAGIARRIAGRRTTPQRARHGAEHLRLLLHAAKSLRDFLHAL
jgi:acyl-CoA synthetase (NDP forming)